MSGRGTVVTPEAVELRFTLGGIAFRSIAVVIDLFVQGAAMLGIGILAAVIGAGSSVVGFVVTAVGILVVVFGIPIFFEVSRDGQTPGHMVAGTRVVTVDGGPLGFRHAALRSLLAIVDLYLSSGAIAIVFAMTTRRGQRLGDLAAGTMVIREPRRSQLDGGSVRVTQAARDLANHHDFSAVSAAEVGLVREVLARQSLSPKAQAELAAQLCAVLKPKCPGPPIPEFHESRYLLAVLAWHEAANPTPAPLARDRVSMASPAPPPPPTAPIRPGSPGPPGAGSTPGAWIPPAMPTEPPLSPEPAMPGASPVDDDDPGLARPG